MYIENLIGDLLVRNNCVIIPSFGGFLAKKVSATIDHASGMMHPPRRLISFNKQLINNDGLLIASYAFQTKTTYEQAHFEIQSQIDQWMLRLNNGERISIEKIGFLFLDQEKNIGFEQDKFVNIYLQSFGMKSIHFISNEDLQLIAEAEATPEKVVIEPKTFEVLEPMAFDAKGIEGEATLDPVVVADAMNVGTKSRIGLWKYAAAAALLPIAFYSYWIPMKTDVLNSGIIAMNDFNPFHKNSTIQYQPKILSVKTIDTSDVSASSLNELMDNLPADVDVISYQFAEDLYIPVKVENHASTPIVEEKVVVAPAVEKLKEEPARKITQTAIQSGNYHLIANCFGSETNAVNYVKFLNSKGFSASIVDVVNGLYRVSAGQAESAVALKTAEDQLKALDVQGAWILKK